MEGRNANGGEGDRLSTGFSDGNRSWAKVVQDSPRQPLWTTHNIAEEVERLQRYLTKLLEFPEEEMEASRKEWEGVAIIIRSLGRWIPLEWVAKEVNKKRKLDYDL